jgi:lipopolysaccharide/colanic/teichoic acid biosynthesis glycosyltransferase
MKIGYSDTVEKMVERLRYDIIYMDNMTLQTDIKILFYSVEVILLGKGQ